MSKHVKLLLENEQKPSYTPLGNPAEAETRRGNFDIKLRLSEKRQESSSFMERRKSRLFDAGHQKEDGRRSNIGFISRSASNKVIVCSQPRARQTAGIFGVLQFSRVW